MKKVLLSALIGITMATSCDKKQADHAEHLKTEQTATKDFVQEAKSDEHEAHTKLDLNNGKKWAVNDEMKPFVAETETQLNAYEPKNGDYKMLASNVSTSTDNLVKSCTMTGVPHDHLHAWLAPHMKEIEKLKKAENRREANKSVDELKESMEKYHTYFN